MRRNYLRQAYRTHADRRESPWAAGSQPGDMLRFFISWDGGRGRSEANPLVALRNLLRTTATPPSQGGGLASEGPSIPPRGEGRGMVGNFHFAPSVFGCMAYRLHVGGAAGSEDAAVRHLLPTRLQTADRSVPG